MAAIADMNDVPPPVPPKSPQRQHTASPPVPEKDEVVDAVEMLLEPASATAIHSVQFEEGAWYTQVHDEFVLRPPPTQAWRTPLKHDWSKSSIRPHYLQCNWYYYERKLALEVHLLTLDPSAHGADKLPSVFVCGVCKYRHINKNLDSQFQQTIVTA